ncbi:hypothetical protein CgunFtcFv8_004667 [Champsocephalus gunnari]|uniref:Uncharacterized protein n=1 Tax=Champsocephalus gunnari TaxID=52237 RepID=A0AAN8HZ21_CHAGU|nr:hypothetical protein CgunFtcFv8_004667 [Champsocephalus gunnari]
MKHDQDEPSDLGVPPRVLRELREIDPPVHMTTTLDVEFGAPFSGGVDFESDEGTTNRLLRLENVALAAQKEALNKEVCLLRNKLKQLKASSAKRALRSSSATPPAESIMIQQPERPASSGRYTPLVEFGRSQSKYVGDEESRGKGLRRPMSAPPPV